VQTLSIIRYFFKKQNYHLLAMTRSEYMSVKQHDIVDLLFAE
jgi:hypothetical protein